MVVRRQIKKKFEINDSMTSFEKIREIHGYQDENFRFEVKMLKKTVYGSVKNEKICGIRG